jgi:renalase
VPSRQPVVVVGAGVSGLACACVLADAGLPVTVLEKRRSLGGRMATRRVDGTVVDHGAQYVTAGEPGFAALLRRLAATGLAEPWATRLHRYERGRLAEGGPAESGRVRWAFPDGMSTLAEQLGRGLGVHRQVRVTALRPAHRSWELATVPQGGWAARALVLALPAPQAVELLTGLAGLEELAGTASRAAYDPCWALVAGYPDANPPTWRGVFVERGPLSFLCHDSSKRHDPTGTVLVAHATGAWTRAHWDDDPARVTGELVAATVRVAGRWAAEPAWTSHRRWAYAQVRETVDAPFLLGGGHAPVGLCGDWCEQAKVEGAWRSGHRLGHALLERVG